MDIMQEYQQDFLRLALAVGALQFGEFVLKSGRVSPYFFNAGLFNSGARLARLGQCYAQAIIHSEIQCDVLYGPAYKGIPIAAATSIALADHHHRDIPYAFNRKEAKDHGEGGVIIGSPLAGRVLILDDVISAGTSVRESVALIQAKGAEPAGVVIALDRQEKGIDNQSAVAQVETGLGLPVIALVRLEHLISYLTTSPQYAASLESLRSYQQCYGVLSNSTVP
jgi:orotate phosphoribosyltransferase